MKKDNFSIWLLAATVMLMTAYFMFEASILTELWDGDRSKISMLILAIGVFFFAKLGRMIYIYDKNKSHLIVKYDLDAGFEASQTVMTLGMIGTIIGFSMMLGSFNGVDISDINSIKQLFSIATDGMATALYTTLSGLSVHLILRTSYWLFERNITQ